MDMLFLIVLVILAGFGLHGYLRGLVRVLFSLVAIFLTIGAATALAPYTAEVLKTRTPLYHTIQEKCTEYLQESASEKIQQKDREEADENQDTVFGMEIPSEIQSFLGESAAEQANGLLKDSGVYEKAGEFVAEQILQRAAWTLSFFIVFVVMLILIHVLDLISKLPVLNSINHIGGLAIGLVQGVIIVWLLFLLIVFCQGNDWGRQMMEAIDDNIFLKFLYDNNLIEQFIMGMLE